MFEAYEIKKIKNYSHENPAHILPLTSMPPSSTEKRNSCLIIVVIIMDGHSNHLDYDVVVAADVNPSYLEAES